MGCPQCESLEISPTGVCLICGYKTKEEKREEAGEAKKIEEAKDVKDEEKVEKVEEGQEEQEPAPTIPQWRQELSTRLHEIQQRREAQGIRPEHKPAPALVVVPPPAASAPQTQPKPAETIAAIQAKLLEKKPARKPQPALTPPPRQKTLEPVESPKPAKTDPADIRNLIDNAVSKKIPHAPAPTAEPFERTIYVPEPSTGEEGRLILLSRTLSGLVDLIVIVLCTGGCILAADYASGIISLDSFSLLNFLGLFLLIHFLYSLFFLSASNQTIGMMITDLRVVDPDDRRPSTFRLLRRCGMYLVSLFGLGIGLLTGLFDRDCKCLHDHVSGTRVVRI